MSASSAKQRSLTVGQIRQFFDDLDGFYYYMIIAFVDEQIVRCVDIEDGNMFDDRASLMLDDKIIVEVPLWFAGRDRLPAGGDT